MTSVEQAARIPLFAGLAPAELAAVASLLAERSYPRQAVIFHEGDPVEAVYFLQEGLVKVSTVTDDGREQTLSLLRPGDFFPHVGFLEGGSYPATAVALTDSRLARLGRAELMRLLEENGRLAVRMLQDLARRLTNLQRRLRHLAHRNLHARLSLALLHLAEEHGAPLPDGAVLLTLPITHQELANLIGAARESVSRALGDLRQAGAVASDPQGRLIVRRRRLVETAAFGRPSA